MICSSSCVVDKFECGVGGDKLDESSSKSSRLYKDFSPPSPNYQSLIKFHSHVNTRL